MGVLGRLNSGQLIEQELSLIAYTVKKKIDKADSLKEKKELLFKFLDIASPDQSSALKVYLSKMNDSEQLEWFKNMDRIILIESPIYCASTKELAELVKIFKPHLSTIYYKNEDGESNPAIRKLIVADEYFIRLKQEPVTKFSVRSKGMNNPRSSLPIKSTQASKHKRVFADQANRIGEQENNILLLSNDFAAIDYFLRSYSTSNSARRSHELFESNPDGGFIINIPEERSRSVDILNAYLKAMGNAIRIDCEKNCSKSVNAKCDIPKIPSYITDMIK